MRPSMITLVSSTSGPAALHLLGKLDIGDNEPKLVLGPAKNVEIVT